MTARARSASSVAVATVLGASLFGGTASAYWRTTGTGTGTGTTGTLTFALTANAATTAGSGTLFPDTAGDLVLQYDNTSVRPVRVTGLLARPLPAATAACKVSLRAPSTYEHARYLLPAGSGTVTVPAAAHMAVDAPSDCQGQTFVLPVTLTVQTA